MFTMGIFFSFPILRVFALVHSFNGCPALQLVILPSSSIDFFILAGSSGVLCGYLNILLSFLREYRRRML